METRPSFRISPQVIIGFAMVLFGILFVLDNIGLIYFDDFFRFWPVVFMAIGLSWIAYSRTSSRRGAGVFLVILGALFLLNSLSLLDFSIWDFWPLILVGIGVGLISQALKRQTGLKEDSSSVVNGIAIMSGVARVSNSMDFQGGELTAIMGGCEVDLREASIARDEAVINTFALWGGIEIKVPDDWTVISHGFALMGAIEIKARPPKGGPKKRLIVKGFALMGGVEITN